MRIMIAVVLVGALSGCYRKEEDSTKAGDFDVQKLFTHDGCTAYRFFDARYVYFVKCENGTVASVESREGKTSHVDEVTTEYQP